MLIFHLSCKRYFVRVFVSCPKPLIVTERPKEPNCGYGFVRFEDKRDRTKAMKDIEAGLIQFNGRAITGKELKPEFWPRAETRRYY